MLEDLLIYMKAQDAIEAIAQRVVELQLASRPVPQPAKPEAEKPIFIPEACEIFGITPPTLREWRLEGRIPYYRKGKRIYFFRSELLASLEQPKRQVARSTGNQGFDRRANI